MHIINLLAYTLVQLNTFLHQKWSISVHSNVPENEHEEEIRAHYMKHSKYHSLHKNKLLFYIVLYKK